MVPNFISIMPISSPNPVSNKGFGEKITQVEAIEVSFMHLIWNSVFC